MLDRGSCVYLHPHPFLLILAFFIWGYKPLFIFTQFFFNLFDPFVIDQMWLLFTRAKHACIALYYTYSCANYRQLQSRSATTAHLATIIFIIHCIWARDIVARAVGQNVFLFLARVISIAIQRESKTKYYQEIWSHFLLVCFEIPPFPYHSQSLPPLFGSPLRFDLCLYNPLLHHCTDNIGFDEKQSVKL